MAIPSSTRPTCATTSPGCGVPPPPDAPHPRLLRRHRARRTGLLGVAIRAELHVRVADADGFVQRAAQVAGQLVAGKGGAFLFEVPAQVARVSASIALKIDSQACVTGLPGSPQPRSRTSSGGSPPRVRARRPVAAPRRHAVRRWPARPALLHREAEQLARRTRSSSAGRPALVEERQLAAAARQKPAQPRAARSARVARSRPA